VTELRVWPRDRGSVFRRAEISAFPAVSRQALRPTHLPMQWLPGAVSRVKNAWSCISSTPPYIFHDVVQVNKVTPMSVYRCPLGMKLDW
jgi:hypothetical protein